MYRIYRFGSNWVVGERLPPYNVQYAMPADVAQRSFFRKSDGGIFTPEGSANVRMAPPETFLYRGSFFEASEADLDTAIKNLSVYKGQRSKLWATSSADDHLFKFASLQRLAYNFASDALYYVAELALEFALEREGWQDNNYLEAWLSVVGNGNVVDLAGNIIDVPHYGNMDNYYAFILTIVPAGGNLTSLVVECQPYDSASPRTTLTYAGTIDAGVTAILDYGQNVLTLDDTVVRPVTRGVGDTLAEWGLLTKTTPTITGGAWFTIYCTGSATSYDAVVTSYNLYAI